jgi:Tfp pilus assembly protein FimT
VKGKSDSGFTLIEALLVIAISIVLAGIAIPVFINAMNNYRLTAAVSAATGAIESTRFQAIMRGYPYQIVFTSSSKSYQIYNEVPPATTFSAVGAAIPLESAGPITMTGTSFTYTFAANGIVTSSANPAGTAFQLKNSFQSRTITVSGVGNVSTSSP